MCHCFCPHCQGILNAVCCVGWSLLSPNIVHVFTAAEPSSVDVCEMRRTFAIFCYLFMIGCLLIACLFFLLSKDIHCSTPSLLYINVRWIIVLCLLLLASLFFLLVVEVFHVHLFILSSWCVAGLLAGLWEFPNVSVLHDSVLKTRQKAVDEYLR